MMQNLGISLQEVKIVAHMDHKLLWKKIWQNLQVMTLVAADFLTVLSPPTS